MEDETTTAAQADASGNGASESVSTEDLASALSAANAKADENYNKFLLAMADLENFRKSNDRRIHEGLVFRHKALIEKFLPVIDNLERALRFDQSTGGLRDGVAQTLKGFESVLASEGVRAIDVKGQPFDPKIAEAIGTQPAEGVEDDTILEEAEKGYVLGDELLRPAKVIVAKNS